MHLKALDQVQVTAVRPTPLLPGEEFQISDDTGELLMKKQPRLFVRVDTPAGKAEQAPQNKSVPPPKNKDNPPSDNKGEAAKKALALADGALSKFKAAAKKVLGNETPGTKDEIVAALTALTLPPEDKKPEDMSDDELKAHLAGKGVTLSNESRDEMLALTNA